MEKENVVMIRKIMTSEELKRETRNYVTTLIEKLTDIAKKQDF